MATPYMNLILPVVGPLGTQGPDWANEINAALTLIDQHDHSSGLGKQITPAGLNINQTFQMNSNQISEIASLALDNLVAQPSSSNLIYEYAGELYFNDANANQVQLTSGGTINVASVGTISGDYGGSNPANVSFSNSTETYLFTKAPGETGSIGCGPISIYQNTAGSYYAKIQQNVAQAANVDWTLPVALPATKLPMKSSASGVLELSQILTSEIADAQITAGKLASNSVETAKIVDLNVTTGKLANQAVTAAKIANATITSTQIASGAVTSTQLAGNSVFDSNINSSAWIKRRKLQSVGTFITSYNSSTTSTSFVSVASISFVPDAFNVGTRVVPTSGLNPSYISIFPTTTGVFYGEFRIIADGVVQLFKRVGGYMSSNNYYYYDIGILNEVFYFTSPTNSATLTLEYRSSSTQATVQIYNTSISLYVI